MQEKILNDLEFVYQQALEKENFAVALRAKELLAKHLHFFDPKPSKPLSLADLTDEDIERLIAEIKERLAKDDKKRL